MSEMHSRHSYNTKNKTISNNNYLFKTNKKMSHVGYGMALSFMASQKNYNACCKFCQKCPGWKGDHGLCTVCNVRWDPHTTCSCEKSMKAISQLFEMFKKWIYF